MLSRTNLFPFLLLTCLGFSGAFIVSRSTGAPCGSALRASPLLGSDSISDLPSLTTAASQLLKPAAEHTQPLWGAPDPYLSSGHSIAPSAKSLTDLGVASLDTSTLTESAQKAASNGWHLLDSTRLSAENLLPGFSRTGGLLPFHEAGLPAETPETFAAQVEWSARFLNVIDNLPAVAFAYALVEFFLLRPNIDVYQEEIQQEPSEVLSATVAVTSVRMAAFAVISVVTCTVFG